VSDKYGDISHPIAGS